MNEARLAYGIEKKKDKKMEKERAYQRSWAPTLGMIVTDVLSLDENP